MRMGRSTRGLETQNEEPLFSGTKKTLRQPAGKTPLLTKVGDKRMEQRWGGGHILKAKLGSTEGDIEGVLLWVTGMRLSLLGTGGDEPDSIRWLSTQISEIASGGRIVPDGELDWCDL